MNDKLLLYTKWFVVWLVVLPVLLHRVEHCGMFASSWGCSLVVGVVIGLCVPLIDGVFFAICRRLKRQV
ncbi:hypothetical protein B7802_18070 [Salmonella enterica]|nr:hypothetical protein [Salmonella enterica]EDV5023667.1 hypothetical protein [Salmonella enterica subsp. enterica serovar Ball]EBD5984725.1 hypothetical protein [Salmonella enterica]EBI4325869.1 hypothetical protein [Salmonella enterica]ECO4389218.1 hypothetical protein [Salmonella enterica]